MRQGLGSIGLVVCALAVAPGPAPGEPAGEESGAVAVVDGTPIAASTLDEMIQGELMELRQREAQLRRQGLEELIAERLLSLEAAARGVSVADLTRSEVVEKAVVSEEEARRFYESNRARFASVGEDQAIQQIVAGLGRQRQRERRSAFAQDLRAKYPVEVLLDPFRVEVDTAEAPTRGNPDAPVTIVEFSDFQCPFCVRARPTLKRVREVYGDEVRFAFRHFPLAFHELAPKAGEAAACAGEQDRFWEMHDRIWAHPGQLQQSDLEGHAEALGMDEDALTTCLDSGRHATTVREDSELGARLGVSGTPAFFINGRPLVGAQPFDAFAAVIDDELARARRASSDDAPAQ